MDLQRWLSSGVAAIDDWQAAFGPFERHRSLRVSDERFASAFSEFTGRLRENYPFFHPSTPRRCSSRRIRELHSRVEQLAYWEHAP